MGGVAAQKNNMDHLAPADRKRIAYHILFAGAEPEDVVSRIDEFLEAGNKDEGRITEEEEKTAAAAIRLAEYEAGPYLELLAYIHATPRARSLDDARKQLKRELDNTTKKKEKKK